jgi:hypothetical protein
VPFLNPRFRSFHIGWRQNGGRPLRRLSVSGIKTRMVSGVLVMQ